MAARPKGTDRGPDLIRSTVVLRDRLGNLIGPAIKPGANHQATLAASEIVDLSHFLHQRVEAIVSNRNARGSAARAHRRSRGRPRVLQRRRPLQHVSLATGDLGGVATRIPTPRTCSSGSCSRRCDAAESRWR
jgi:hypothetical protein